LETGDVITYLIAVVGLAVGVIAALVSRRHDREQQARPILLEPSTSFARATLRALAAMRHVTPPWVPTASRLPHRNEELLNDAALRGVRLDACRIALDDVRPERAAVRLVFHPSSRAAALSADVLGELRSVLEAAEHFYAAYDSAVVVGRGGTWREQENEELRERYLLGRRKVYERLDRFLEEVAQRLIRPSWNPRRYASERTKSGEA
jgi:hypothetical protein